MGKTLNELIEDLKDFMIDEQSDARNANNTNKYKYNNLKLSLINPNSTPMPLLKISIGISEVVFDITTRLKVSGSLGNDEKYVFRWLGRTTTIIGLQECYKNQIRQPIKDDEKEERS